jgi:hypothetical protein
VVKRARKAGSPGDPAPPDRRNARRIVAVILTLGLVAGLLFGLWRLGEVARRNIGPRDRYAVPFADIQCDAPPGMTRETFLVEVRYTANAAPTIQALDPELKATLTVAFASHPWVARVDAVTVEPPNAVSVKLTFRTPVLAIRTAEGPRAVDAKGILLPATAPTAGLPELLSPVAAPVKAGQPWPDAAVIRAASVAAEYKPKTIERTEQGWQLIQPDGKKLTVGR